MKTLREMVIKLLVGCIIVAVLFGCGSYEPQPPRQTYNIVPYMREALDNPILREKYADDIYMVENHTISGWADFYYYEFDLNSDGNMDKIVTLNSGLHGGWNGTALDFLIGNADGTFDKITGQSVFLYGVGEGFHASMYILDEKTNGFYDILIVEPAGGRRTLLKFEPGRFPHYRIYSITEPQLTH